MRSGLVVTFLFYPVADLAQNVHRCVLSYSVMKSWRDGVPPDCREPRSERARR
jgi:hypothetical protein